MIKKIKKSQISHIFHIFEVISKLLKNLKAHLLWLVKGAFSAVTAEGSSLKLPFTPLCSCIFDFFEWLLKLPHFIKQSGNSAWLEKYKNKSRRCGTVLFAGMIFYTYCLLMEIWQNHFLKKQFSSDQIWRKYLFFEKLWDSCVKKTEKIIAVWFFTGRNFSAQQKKWGSFYGRQFPRFHCCKVL